MKQEPLQLHMLKVKQMVDESKVKGLGDCGQEGQGRWESDGAKHRPGLSGQMACDGGL